MSLHGQSIQHEPLFVKDCSIALVLDTGRYVAQTFDEVALNRTAALDSRAHSSDRLLPPAPPQSHPALAPTHSARSLRYDALATIAARMPVKESSFPSP